MQIQKLKLGQQNNDEGSINLAGANKNASLKCKKIIIKTLAKLYQSVYCHSTNKYVTWCHFVYFSVLGYTKVSWGIFWASYSY